jgi:hypothetical protein
MSAARAANTRRGRRRIPSVKEPLFSAGEQFPWRGNA